MYRYQAEETDNLIAKQIDLTSDGNTFKIKSISNMKYLLCFLVFFLLVGISTFSVSTMLNHNGKEVELSSAVLIGPELTTKPSVDDVLPVTLQGSYDDCYSKKRKTGDSFGLFKSSTRKEDITIHGWWPEPGTTRTDPCLYCGSDSANIGDLQQKNCFFNLKQ